MVMRAQLLISLLLICFLTEHAQKYNFVNWTVEDGLIQSQASSICQDKYRQLWIGTEGGISRFDGRKFIGYTVNDGLVANDINTLFRDKTGNIWMGTNYGISVFNGHDFKTVTLTKSPVSVISQIAQTNNGHIYAIDNFNLLEITDLKSKKIRVSGDTAEKITNLYHTQSDHLLAFVYGKGIYNLNNGKWNLLSKIDDDQKKLFIRKIFISSKNDTILASGLGLYHLKNNKLVPYEFNNNKIPELLVLCIEEDAKKNLWLGSDNGVYKIEGNELLHFDEKNGFTDNAVNYIYRDAENILWFAVNGDGIYKFRENTFTYYDKSSGLSNTIIMGVVETKDKTVYAAGYGGGLFKINSQNDLEPVIYHGPVLQDSKINCLYADDMNVWIGTLNKGTYRFNEKTGLQKLGAKSREKNDPQLEVKGTTCFFKDAQGNLLMGNNRAILVKDKNDQIKKIKVGSALVTALKQFDNDHVIIATSKGIFLMDNAYEVEPCNEKDFGNSSVLCLSKNGDHVWIGTTDKGVLNWNFKTGKIITYTTADGLPSNFIYSIDVSDKQKAWIGTGFGISNLQLNEEGKVLAIKNYGRSDGLLGMECNHNCLLKASDSSLWFGTTKGLFHFNPYTNISEKTQPLVLLRSVKLFSSEITDSSLFAGSGGWFRAPEQLKLHSKQNHITFELGAIFFTNPEDVLYKYKLEGIDKGFTTTNNPNIIYPALPPGKYTLKVMGITKSGAISSNELHYPFEIEKAFYQTRFFQIVVILLLLGAGALLAYIFTRGRQKRKQKAKELLEKIREEEFMKLRQRTAEDFHDEMGNSLTRISVLTDVLKSKINGKEQEVTKLVQQIKENTTSLYNGSRDIIWSLNSRNDGIYEIAEHIRDIGNELFQETPIDFAYTHNVTSFNSLKLKLDYSRNLTMIFKEAYNNILKHSHASKVEIIIDLINNHDLDIVIRDNGVGFETDTAKSGNGIKNMESRSKRMNGDLVVESALKKGTEINIVLRNIFI
jgi:signal transduction histidine kinase/ligand-binding sensor domain-containing protein